jgi:PAS domain-containing protein
MLLKDSYAAEILNAIPGFVFVVDRDVRILDWNRNADRICGADADSVLKARGGEFTCCVNRDADCRSGECPQCSRCVLRRSVLHALDTGREVKAGARMEFCGPGGNDSFYALISAAPIEKDGQTVVVLAVQDFGVAADVDRNIPVCSSCHRIRNSEGKWELLEGFMKRNFGVDCSHGICPDCYERDVREMKRIFGT